jgi:hypothetical protein
VAKTSARGEGLYTSSEKLIEEETLREDQYDRLVSSWPGTSSCKPTPR